MKTLQTYAVFLDFITYPKPGESVRVRKQFEQEAEDMFEAIHLVKAKHGGKLWLIYETAESQARH